MTEETKPVKKGEAPEPVIKERRTLLEIFARKYPHIKEWQWHISVALDIGFYIMLIVMFILVRDSSIMNGLTELNKSCDICLASCKQAIMNISPVISP